MTIPKSSLLQNVRVASPCSMPWSEMEGDDRRRFCGSCKLYVHDVSALTVEEAERLLLGSANRMCVRIHRRADGRLLTRDCPVGRSAVRRRLAYAGAIGFAMLVSGLGSAAAIASGKGGSLRDRFNIVKDRTLGSKPFQKLAGEEGGTVTAGILAAPSHQCPSGPDAMDTEPPFEEEEEADSAPPQAATPAEESVDVPMAGELKAQADTDPQ